ncbi:MAG: hypothetical protein OXM55_08335 [Bdellovibrionales bacterium]|nr:hypothetical protein [Bdellovibrionales bacterium]
MKQLFIFLFATLLVGCSSPIYVSSEDTAPPWVNDLASEVDSGEKMRGTRTEVGKKGKIVKRVPKTIDDQVVAQPEPPTPVEPVENTEPVEPPLFVAELKKQITPSVGKQSRKPGNTTDLVGEKPSSTVVSPSVSQSAPVGPVKTDVVVIVDSSPSMLHFLRKVPKTFSGFIPALNPLDWKMMFTNGDYGFLSRKGKAMSLEDDGRSLRNNRYLSKSMPDYPSIFIDTLRVHKHYEYFDQRGDHPIASNSLPPYSQFRNEEPLKALKASFTKNIDFHRSDADVLVGIIFSDSDEGEHTRSEKRVQAEEVQQAFESAFGSSGKKLLVYSIIMIPEEDAECVEKYRRKGLLGGYGGEGVFGMELARIAELTGGRNFSLCDENYIPLAKQIVSDVQSL